ncbi:P-loop containing nucleoside triphosphate hydrolase protein [Suhomyces tanzawaensis NRRL Y-17324]|uniref:RNA helicase n=1 Tax=Suhomyces tanzawaensis NRRL Y-17324 TaxID=984487 RepID=A0A1E4SI53_9ASCO|nr:P-loop containing nucleoside triphosphate hydrolase protein [Suhomyces tanzawaensis NRRL Y-17324]ODV79198.1 P-loop containing nucleoside triphosphate hydrolase protein [Suhomyces tanzawaensis NRRL Y-17324]
MSFQTGRGQRRKRDLDWDDEQPEEQAESQQHTSQEKQSSKPEDVLGQKETEAANSGSVANTDAAADLRNASRKQYLQKRQQLKLEQLDKEIQDYESLPHLSNEERKDYNKKKQIYKVITEASVQEERVQFQLQDDSQDKKRKHEILHAKTEYDDKEDTTRTREKKNRYENQWELDQMKKASQLSTIDTDKINLPDQDQYEFVFDESQYVDFDQNEVIKGNEDPLNVEEEMEKKRMTILEVRESLPVFKFKQQFLETVQENQVLIVVGETGSGKTTQLPQYLDEAGYSKGTEGNKLIIGCTQPRRVAATSVATRVAEEYGCKLGEQVGYTIRFEDKSNENTVIKYLTDGMLLREFLNDPELSKYGALMIDEAHERTLSTEILLSLLKDICQARSDLKLIVASATINATKFSEFFNNAPILNIPGRRFPVEIHYTKNPEANYIQAAITTIFQIHLTQDLPGDILVFLTGQDEIETMEESLNESVAKLGSQIKPLLVCSIYANLPNEAQAKIFEPTPKNSRKVVLATNIAETSITIDGIAYVIDPGYVKQNVFNSSTGMESLVVVPCSRASADQRAGRAGRVGPGKCFRLYTKWSFYNELELNPVPEILRVKLTSVVLLLLSLGINDLINFDFMDPPSSESIIKALELLYSLGALSSLGELTKVGRKMAEFPIDPMFTKALLQSSKYGVFEDILSIMSMLGESGTLYYRPKDKKEQADKAHEKFSEEQGDHLTLLKIWNEWVETGYSNTWCQDHFVQYKTLKRVRHIREQLERLCKKIGIEDETDDNENKPLMIQKAILSGFFPNIARISKMGDSFRRLKQNQAVYIHPSSSLHSLKPPPKVVLYHELVLTSKEFMRNCMIIEEKWIKEFASHFYSGKDLEFLDRRKR